MAWVKSEYAGELAVLSTWLVAIAPWSVSVFGNDQITGVVFRFLPFRVQYLYGITISNELNFVWAWEVVQLQAGTRDLLAAFETVTLRGGYIGRTAVLWTAALAVMAVAFAASAYYYHREDEFTERVPLHPVRVFGGLLGAVGLLLLGGTALLNLPGGFAGWTIPVGALVAPVLAGVLLTADLT
ncbi:DUF7549 family protein [Haloarcula laminariae]|uniref:DUF7549 family protein n=1 Tax=Haloarcula laminariae TaxID=2961577 RepID=UPI0021C6262A|nr:MULTISPECIES: TIGR04206 family protein [Halomicroarcula]